MDAITSVPEPVNEPVRTYAPGSPETESLRSRIAELEGERHELTMTIGGEQRMAGGDPIDVVQPHDHAHVLGRQRAGRHQGRGRRGQRRQARRARVARAALRRAGRGPAAGRRPRRRTVARHPQRRDRPRPVEVRPAGRDRRRLRADRLLAVQRRLRPPHPRRAAGVEPGHLEPVRPPAAGRVRHRDHPVQLHRHRRQPADRARADGQHGRVEALADPAARRALHDAPARGRRPAARRDQHGHRRRRRGQRGRPRRPGLRRPALHRLHQDLPVPVALDGRAARHLPLLPADRRRDRRQGLRRRAPVGRPRGRRDRARARRVRVPGPEVLGGLARLRLPFAVGVGPARAAGRHDEDPVVRRRHGLRPLRWRGDRLAGLRQAQGRAGDGREHLDARGAGRRKLRRLGRLLRPADDPARQRPDERRVHHRVVRPDPRGPRVRRRRVLEGPGAGRRLHAVRADRRRVRHRPRRRSRRRTARCASRPATSTSTTSRPAPSSASSPSAAAAARAPTTRPARSTTSSGG